HEPLPVSFFKVSHARYRLSVLRQQSPSSRSVRGPHRAVSAMPRHLHGGIGFAGPTAARCPPTDPYSLVPFLPAAYARAGRGAGAHCPMPFVRPALHGPECCRAGSSEPEKTAATAVVALLHTQPTAV